MSAGGGKRRSANVRTDLRRELVALREARESPRVLAAIPTEEAPPRRRSRGHKASRGARIGPAPVPVVSHLGAAEISSRWGRQIRRT